LLAVPLVLYYGDRLGAEGQGLGILGGGYGAAQMSITGADWLPAGWGGVELLLLLAGAKILASAFTIGTGGSAGDFAPSIVLGALLGGAFGRAAQIVLDDPTIDPGAFALVGMGTFYGGIAHVPLAALVLVSEMAGSYDLLVPLMLAEGIAFVLLRRRSLYHAQVATLADSPVHRVPTRPDVLVDLRVADVVVRDRPYVSFTLRTPLKQVLERLPDFAWQDAFPVSDDAGALKGLVTSDSLRFLASHRDMEGWAVAADVMQPAVTVREDATLRVAADLMLANRLRELPVVSENGKIIGFLDEADIAQAHLAAGASRPGSAGGAG
jgi:CIC family chloride channel protein